VLTSAADIRASTGGDDVHPPPERVVRPFKDGGSQHRTCHRYAAKRVKRRKGNWIARDKTWLSEYEGGARGFIAFPCISVKKRGLVPKNVTLSRRPCVSKVGIWIRGEGRTLDRQ
jgi:hypothetical protein